MENVQILNTSDKAAEFKTNISGWVDRHGRFWGKDERMARWSGCTHLLCPGCGKVMPKEYTLCDECREKKAIERHKARKGKPWDGVTPLYSDAFHVYFFSWDEVLEYLDDIEYPEELFDDLRLLICEPVYLQEVEGDYFENSLSDDGALPSDVVDALEDLNTVIRGQGPVSWFPGKYVAIINQTQLAQENIKNGN